MRRLPLVLLLTMTASLASGQLFRSNSLGMRFEPVQSTGDADYVLQVVTEVGQRQELLYQSGELVSRTVTFPGEGPATREEDYEGSVLQRTRHYGHDGRLEREVERLREDREILKKALEFFSRESK